ncbi:hypothetical protein [Asinibacterium sp. OR53]|uniref:hypothetical protein n=1 Tax=Asinibacterium sp. OR53 TaxID=925409 RepID=UPI000479B7D8|nr:hypothetical protein [Asinibacterium sp. OR53]
MTKENKPAAASIILLFLFVNGIVFFFKSNLDGWGIDSKVIIGSNVLLGIIGVFSVLAQERSLRSNNPNAWIRMVMVSTFIKLIVLGIAAVVYMTKAGVHKNKYAIFISMGLYVLYTWIEVRTSLKLNKKSNAGN